MKYQFKDISLHARKEWEALQSNKKPVIRVGTATCGSSAGAFETLKALRDEISDSEIDSERAKELVKKHVIHDDPVVEYALGTMGKGSIKGILPLKETAVVKLQTRRILKKCGLIDPVNLNHYIANKGYTGLKRAMTMSCLDIIDEIKESGLRGRGGARFATGVKWRFCYEAPGNQKYLICNADEGDPHSLIEGMGIAGKGIGASKGYIYCRAEYPLALERLELAINQARSIGFLGENIMGSGFDFDIIIKKGAGVFVCGEETALIASIEGTRGMPRPRPPFPAVSGLWEKPTIINNVETLASVALIMQNSAEWFNDFGC